MPGRQAHGRPLLPVNGAGQRNGNRGGSGGRPNKRKASGGGGNGPRNGGSAELASARTGSRRRMVDVMAMAERQIGETKIKGVRMRGLDDDDFDEDEKSSKRRRTNKGGDDEDEDDEDGEGQNDGPVNSEDEMHSDSSGNEWHAGVNEDEDSEIDSDEALGDGDSDDGYAFGGSLAAPKKKKSKKGKKRRSRQEEDDDPFGDSEEEDDVGDDGADLGDEAIDLATALDQYSSGDESEEEEEEQPKKGKKTKPKAQASDSEDDLDSDDLEEASKKSRKSKTAKAQTSNSEDSKDDSSDDRDSVDSNGEAYDNPSSVSDFDGDEDSNSDEDDSEIESESDDSDAEPMDFTFVKKATQAVAGKDQEDSDAMDVDDDDDDSDAVMDIVDEPGSRKKQSSTGASTDTAKDKKKKAAAAKKEKAKVVDVPLAPMLQSKEDRKAAATKAHETIDRWTETVKHNHRADHLSFPIAGDLREAGVDVNPLELAPIRENTAQTELEKTILSIMEESGMGTVNKRKKEFAREQKELKESVLSPEELRALVSQKRRDRDLAAREATRARRIKKIKSKAFRRVHRRQAARDEARMAESGSEDDEDVDSEAERDAAHRRRALERMGGRHRESKWAKRGKKTGTNRAVWDEEYREGLESMARREVELRRRVEGLNGGDADRDVDGGDSGSDGEGDGGAEDEDDEAFQKRMMEELRQANEDVEGGFSKNVRDIPFMKRAEQRREKENEEAILETLKTLRQENGEIGLSDDESADEFKVVGRQQHGGGVGVQGKKPAKTSKAAIRPESVDDEEEDAGSVPATADATADATAADRAAAWSGPAADADADADAVARKNTAAWDGATVSSSSKKNKQKSDHHHGVIDNETGLSVEVNDKAKPAAKSSNAKSAPDSETSSSGSDSDGDEDVDRQDTSAPAAGGGRRRHLQGFSDADAQKMMQILGDDDAAAEFAAEKARLAAEEADADNWTAAGAKDDFGGLPGWGTWVGDGISKKQQRKEQQRLTAKQRRDKKVQEKKIAARKDAKLDKVIISEKHVKKNDLYLASTLPHEFETRHQYERSLRLPVGPEWSTKESFQDATKPRLLLKQGVVLPMAKPKQ